MYVCVCVFFVMYYIVAQSSVFPRLDIATAFPTSGDDASAVLFLFFKFFLKIVGVLCYLFDAAR